MQKRKAAGLLLLVIAVAGVVVASIAIARDRAEAGRPVTVVQAPDIWRARQQLVWKSADRVREAELESRRRIAEAVQAEEDADIALIVEGDTGAMKRQGLREDAMIRSIIGECDPAVVAQLPPVEQLAWPLTGAMKVTSPYGERVHPIIGEEAFHRGIDLRARYGSPLLAPADGVVLYTGTKTEYGNVLIVLHGSGIATVYGHLWKFAVQPWQRVSRGQLLGYTGNTGFSTGPHLHFEVRQGGEPTDPLEWLPIVEADGTEYRD